MVRSASPGRCRSRWRCSRDPVHPDLGRLRGFLARVRCTFRRTAIFRPFRSALCPRRPVHGVRSLFRRSQATGEDLLRTHSRPDHHCFGPVLAQGAVIAPQVHCRDIAFGAKRWHRNHLVWRPAPYGVHARRHVVLAWRRAVPGASVRPDSPSSLRLRNGAQDPDQRGMIPCASCPGTRSGRQRLVPDFGESQLAGVTPSEWRQEHGLAPRHDFRHTGVAVRANDRFCGDDRLVILQAAGYIGVMACGSRPRPWVS